MSTRRSTARPLTAAVVVAAAATLGLGLAAPPATASPEKQGGCERLIAYREGGPIGTSSRLMAVPESGGTAQPVYDGPLSELDPDWSRDGRRLVFATRLSTAEGVIEIGLDVLDVSTGSVRTVLRQGPSFVRFPEWSPGDDQIAYTSSQGVPEPSHQYRALRIVGADGAGDRLVTVLPQGNFIRDLAWHPDGDRIYVTSLTPEFHWRLWSVDLETEERLLLDDSGSLGYPRFFDGHTPWMIIEGDEVRPDGDGDPSNDVSYASLYLTHERTLTPQRRIFDVADGQWSPALSPDGDEVAYLRFPPFARDPHRLQVVSLVDGTVRELVGPLVGQGAFAREGLSWQPRGACVTGFAY